MNGTRGDNTASAAPNMKRAPVVILNRVNRSDRTCAVRTCLLYTSDAADE